MSRWRQEIERESELKGIKSFEGSLIWTEHTFMYEDTKQCQDVLPLRHNVQISGFKLQLVLYFLIFYIQTNLLNLMCCFYLKVWVGVGVGQPRRPGVLLVLEGSIKDLRYGAEIEGTHCRCSNAVSVIRNKNTQDTRRKGYATCNSTHFVNVCSCHPYTHLHSW